METPPPAQPLLKRLGFASVLAIAAVALPPISGFLVLGYMDTIARWFDSHREYGLAIYIAAFAVLSGLALLPTYAQAILGGWAFGIVGGFPAAMLGFTGGALIGYGVARPTASDRVTKVIDSEPKWAAVRDALLPSSQGRKGGTLRTLAIVTLLRLPPNSPFAITNFVLASVRVPLWIYCIGTIIGMAPRTFAAVWLGHALHGQIASITKEEIKKGTPWWLFALGIVAMVVVLAVIGLIANRAIERVTRSGVNPPASPDPAT